MDILKALFLLFVLIFPITEVGRIQFANGVAVSINDIFLFAVIVVWIIRYIYSAKNKKVKSNILTKPAVVFLSICFLSLIINIPNLNLEKFLISFSYLVRFSSYLLIYFIVKEFDKNFKSKLEYALLFSGTAVVAIGYIQFFFYPSLRNLFYLGWDEHLYRMFSSFLDPNFAGAFFVLFFIFSLIFVYRFIQLRNLLKLFLTSIISIFTFIAVYLTYSRSAFLMLILSVCAYLFLLKKRKLIFFVAGAIILLIFLAPKSFKTEGTDLFRITSTYERVGSVRAAIDIFGKSPVIGVGFNAYRYALNKYEKMDNSFWQTTHSGGGTDNSFLFVLATTGIIGLTSYFYLLYKIFKLGKENLKKNKYSIALVSIMIGLIINSLFVNSLFFVFILEWVFIIAGLTESS